MVDSWVYGDVWNNVSQQRRYFGTFDRHVKMNSCEQTARFYTSVLLVVVLESLPVVRDIVYDSLLWVIRDAYPVCHLSSTR